MIKLNKTVRRVIIFLAIAIYITAIPLNTTHASQDFRKLTNEFIGVSIMPIMPEGPKTPEKPAGESPKTGDDADPRGWIILITLSVIILRRILFFRKRKEGLK